MPTKITPKISLVDFIKLIWAVVIIYLWLSLRVSQVWESVLDLFQKDYLINDEHNAYSLEELISILSKEQSWSGQNNFDDFCKQNTKICKKLTFKSQYDQDQKINYLSGAVYVVWWMDKYIILGKNITKSFDLMNVQKEKSTKRAWTRGNNVFVNTNTIVYDDEYVQLLWHEFGHILDLYSINGLSSKKDKNFTEFNKSIFSIDDPSIEFYKISWNTEKIRKTKTKPEDFCSGYGMYDVFEDFAECNNLYLNHNDIFKLFANSNSVLKKKYNFIASIYNWKYLNKDTKNYVLAKQKTMFWRPWDTTKIKINN